MVEIINNATAIYLIAGLLIGIYFGFISDEWEDCPLGVRVFTVITNVFIGVPSVLYKLAKKL